MTNTELHKRLDRIRTIRHIGYLAIVAIGAYLGGSVTYKSNNKGLEDMWKMASNVRAEKDEKTESDLRIYLRNYIRDEDVTSNQMAEANIMLLSLDSNGIHPDRSNVVHTIKVR